MIVYLLNIVFIIWWAIGLLYLNPTCLKRKIFCIIVSVQWILLSGLRHITVGADTYAYKIYSFDVVKNISWEEIFNRFYKITFLGQSGKDPAYSIIEKTFQIFCDDYQIFLIFIAISFTVPLGLFIYKYSKYPCASYLIYSCLFYSFFAITGHRQTIVTGIGLFWGINLIKKRKLFSFLLLICILSTVHKSILCLIPFYFVSKINVKFKYGMIMIGIFIIIFIFKNFIMQSLAFFMGYDEYANQFLGAGTPTFTLILVIITILAIWKMPNILNNNKDNDLIRITYNAIFMALLYTPLTYVDPSAMRVVQYFSLFIIIMIPEIIQAFNSRERKIVYILGIGLMILLFIKGNPQYLFLWEGRI